MLTVLFFVLLFVAVGLIAQATLEIKRLKKDCIDLAKNCESAAKICEDAVKSLKEGRG